MQERLFTIAQVADLLCTSSRDVHKWIDKGWLAGKPGIGAAPRVSERSLIAFLKDRGIDIMQLMVSSAVQEAGPHPAHGSKDAPTEADTPQAPTRDPAAPDENPTPDRHPASDEQGEPEPTPIRPKVIHAADGPSGSSLNEDVAAAMEARQILTGKQTPADTEEPTPLPSLNLPAPSGPRPPKSAIRLDKVLGLPAGATSPSQLLNEDEVTALLGGHAPKETAAETEQPTVGEDSPSDTPDIEPAQPADTPPSPAGAEEQTVDPPEETPEESLEDLGPFTGRVEDIEVYHDSPTTEEAPPQPKPKGDATLQTQTQAVSDTDEQDTPTATETTGSVGDQLATTILDEAITRGATHLHLHFGESGPKLQLRVDGRLIEKPNFHRLNPHAAKALLTKLKDLADLARADASRPRTGRFIHTAGSDEADMTLSTLPTVEGLRVTIAVFPRGAEATNLASLGLATGEIERVERLLAEPGGGLLLVCSPERNDRRDMLRVLAARIADLRRDVLVVSPGLAGEPGNPWNPPQPHLAVDNVCCACVDPAAGYRISDLAGQLARQDADAVILADLPDPTTARAAIEAAQAGALVVAGISAQTPADAIGLLAEMNVESWPLAARLRGTIACQAARADDENAPRAALVEPSRQLVRLIRSGANADAIAESAAETDPDCLADKSGQE